MCTPPWPHEGLLGEKKDNLKRSWLSGREPPCSRLPFRSAKICMQLIIKPEDFAPFYELFSWVDWFAMEPVLGFKSNREP